MDLGANVKQETIAAPKPILNKTGHKQVPGLVGGGLGVGGRTPGGGDARKGGP